MSPPSTFRIRVDGTRFRDSANREVILHGLNVAADAKFPAGQPSHIREGFFEGDDVSFVGRPFAVEDARTHFSRIRKWGFNTIRYIFTWEAIEHAGPGKYDEDWIKHTISILRIAGEYGFTVFMDPHQDTVCLSRISILLSSESNPSSGRGIVAVPELLCGPFMHAA